MNTIVNVLNKITYPGRGIIIGLSPNGENLCIAYFIMGRSQNSKNRIFKFQKNSLQTLPLNNDVKNRNLIIYKPIIKYRNFVIISNGNQTKTILHSLQNGQNFSQALNLRNFENDAPIYTPRIAAIAELTKKRVTYKLAIVKKATASFSTERFFFEYEQPKQGYGHFIHTYTGKTDNETKSFNSIPHTIKIPNSHEKFQLAIWKTLNKNNKISLFTEFINLKTKKCSRKIVNKNKQIDI